MRLKLWPRSANSSRPEMAMRWERSPSASFERAAQELGERSAQAAQQQDHERKSGENGERRMDLAHALEPAQELGRVGIDPDDLGGLVGNADLDQLVELLVDAAFEQIGQLLPGDVRAAAAAQLLDLAELVERALEFLPDFRQAA